MFKSRSKCNNTGRANTGDHNTGDNNTGGRNTGGNNTGYDNTGNYNTGDDNTGDFNAGDRNVGFYNAGSFNTGHHNVGIFNAGDHNTGEGNTGNHNIGDHNAGDWNISSCNAGCFMTEEQKIPMFNKPSDWTYMDWLNSKAREIMRGIPDDAVKWIDARNMSDKEKTENPEYKTTGGYLAVPDGNKTAQSWWNELPEEDKEVIKSIPNFDAGIFKQCTGIDVNQ